MFCLSQVAGAAAAAGLSLDDVAAEAKHASEIVGTMGVALTVQNSWSSCIRSFGARKDGTWSWNCKCLLLVQCPLNKKKYITQIFYSSADLSVYVL